MWDNIAKTFKFSIGDLVQHKTLQGHPMVVVFRSLIDCGPTVGIRKSYTTTSLQPINNSGINGFTEDELEPYVAVK